jgi:hypothetical protein
MTSTELEKQISDASQMLLQMAKDLTWNKFSDNIKFIIKETKDSSEDFNIEKLNRKIENDKKIPVNLNELIPLLHRLYTDLHDVNLYIYKASAKMTIIEIQYYPKSSLPEKYRLEAINVPSMLHCKVAIPPWLSDKNKKFDINWEHKPYLIRLGFLWMRIRFRLFGEI